MREKLRLEWKRWSKLGSANALYDRTLLWIFVGLLAIGFVAVTTASIPLASGPKYNEPFYFSMRDAAYILVALAAFAYCLQVPSDKWEKNSIWLLGIALLSLFLVLLIGRSINGAVRWIALGPVNFQPAELAKLALICYLSRFYQRKFDEMRQSNWAFLRPSAVLLVFGFFLMLQPDFGTSAVLGVLTFSLLFIVGAPIKQFFFVALVLGTLGVIGVLSSEYRLGRVTNFIDPFADPYGGGYQLSNAQMAFGQGELFGSGLGNSIQKLSYLTEAHNDFITAVIGEEFGHLGISVLVILWITLTFRVVKISRESLIAERRFSGLFSFGIAMWIFMQGFVNLGAASGLIPTKGLTFPFVSYGGSSLIIMSIGLAAVVRIDHENRLARLGHTYTKEED